MKNELYHYGVLGMKWGVRKDPRSSRRSISDEDLSSRINKLDTKTGKLDTKARKYSAKAAKYNRKANKAKRIAANPIIGRTDFREAANYTALRFEGKGLKYTHKSEKLNTKASKLRQERIKLGKERVDRLKKQHNLALSGSKNATWPDGKGGDWYEYKDRMQADGKNPYTALEQEQKRRNKR